MYMEKPCYSSSQPIYKQIQALILEHIESGRWPVHTKLPDEVLFAQELGVSRGTLRRALEYLVSEGVLSQVRGKGTFVSSNTVEQPLASKLVSFAESMQQQSLSYKTVVLKKEKLHPDLKVAAYLELAPDEEVYLLERVRLVRNTPVIYLKNYLPARLCPDFLENDFVNDDLFTLLEKRYKQKIQWGRRYFKAVPALGEVAQNLGVLASAPVLHLEQIIYGPRQEPIECSALWINSDHFDIVSILQR